MTKLQLTFLGPKTICKPAADTGVRLTGGPEPGVRATGDFVPDCMKRVDRQLRARLDGGASAPWFVAPITTIYLSFGCFVCYIGRFIWLWQISVVYW